MNTRTLIAFVRLVRATGNELQYAVLGGRRYASHDGSPILVCDYLPVVDGEGTVWCMTLGLGDNGVFGMVPDGIGDDGLVIELAQGALASTAAIYRVRWYVAVVLRQTRGLARLDFDAAASKLPTE